MSHKMISNNFFTVFTSLTFSVALKIFFGLAIVCLLVMIMTDNRLNINFFVLAFDYESLHIDKPPIATFIFNKIRHEFLKMYFQVPTHKINNILNILESLVCEFCVHALCCFEGMRNLCIYNKLVYFWHFCCRSVLVGGIYHIGLAWAFASPASSHNWGANTRRFYEPLYYRYLISMS